MPETYKTIKYLNKKKYIVAVVTNQSGIGRGYFTEADLNRLHNYIQSLLLKKGCHIDDFIYCPHHPEAKIKKFRRKCNCRKPENGMIKEVINKWQVNIAKSFMIGDKETDMQCATKSKLKFSFRKRRFLSQVKNLT